jgi:hypothetical protein
MKRVPHPAPHSAPEISLRRTTPEDLPRMFELQADPASNAMAGAKRPTAPPVEGSPLAGCV